VKIGQNPMSVFRGKEKNVDGRRTPDYGQRPVTIAQ